MHFCESAILRKYTSAKVRYCENTLLRKCTFAKIHFCENALLRKCIFAKIHFCESALLRKYTSAKVHYNTFAKVHYCENTLLRNQFRSSQNASDPCVFVKVFHLNSFRKTRFLRPAPFVRKARGKTTGLNRVTPLVAFQSVLLERPWSPQKNAPGAQFRGVRACQSPV